MGPAGLSLWPTCEQAVAHDDVTPSSVTRSGFGSQCKACQHAASNDAYVYRTYKIT
jgi:hypothetical protein